MIKLGTHNSMTYLKPNGSLQELGRTFGKCQNLTIDEQYDFGVRFFDLRIRFHPDGISLFAHGFLEFFGVDPYAVIRALDKKGDCIIQLVMESNSVIADSQNDFFTDFCRTCEQEFTHTVFTGGWSKYPSSGTVVYPFQSALVPRQEAYKIHPIKHGGQRGKRGDKRDKREQRHLFGQHERDKKPIKTRA